MAADVVYVSDNGLSLLAQRVVDANIDKYAAWGTGTTPATVTDTALQSSASPTTTTAVAGTLSRVTTNTTNDTIQVVATIVAASTLSITEVVLLNQAAISGATQLLRGTFDPIVVNSSEAIEFTFKIPLNQG